MLKIIIKIVKRNKKKMRLQIHAVEETLELCPNCLHGEKMESELTFINGAYICHKNKGIPNDNCYMPIQDNEFDSYLDE